MAADRSLRWSNCALAGDASANVQRPASASELKRIVDDMRVSPCCGLPCGPRGENYTAPVLHTGRSERRLPPSRIDPTRANREKTKMTVTRLAAALLPLSAMMLAAPFPARGADGPPEWAYPITPPNLRPAPDDAVPT